MKGLRLKNLREQPRLSEHGIAVQHRTACQLVLALLRNGKPPFSRVQRCVRHRFCLRDAKQSKTLTFITIGKQSFYIL